MKWINLIRDRTSGYEYSVCINVDLCYIDEQLLASQEIQCLMELVITVQCLRCI
jgi:hypothetical protein